jgi:PPOX class probable F420-dependent enzyme
MNAMDATEMRRRVEAARVARLATAGAEGRVHIVPICFALGGQTLYFAVDAKPKRTANLKRLRNIAANPEVSILVDHYEEDWDNLWWVRLDGTARVETQPGEVDVALKLLGARYAQYRVTRPAGPVVAVAIERMTGWSASRV